MTTQRAPRGASARSRSPARRAPRPSLRPIRPPSRGSPASPGTSRRARPVLPACARPPPGRRPSRARAQRGRGAGRGRARLRGGDVPRLHDRTARPGGRSRAGARGRGRTAARRDGARLAPRGARRRPERGRRLRGARRGARREGRRRGRGHPCRDRRLRRGPGGRPGGRGAGHDGARPVGRRPRCDRRRRRRARCAPRGPRQRPANRRDRRPALDAGAPPGRPVLCDLVPRPAAYWGDSCATFVVGGEGSPGLREAHRRSREALSRAVELVRPGARAGDIDAAIRSGLDYPHHTGHGLGTGYHEEPRIVPESDTVLEPGMVVALEPGVYDEDAGEGVRVEQIVVVTRRRLRGAVGPRPRSLRRGPDEIRPLQQPTRVSAASGQTRAGPTSEPACHSGGGPDQIRPRQELTRDSAASTRTRYDPISGTTASCTRRGRISSGPLAPISRPESP